MRVGKGVDTDEDFHVDNGIKENWVDINEDVDSNRDAPGGIQYPELVRRILI